MKNRIDNTEIGRRLSIARKIAGKKVGDSAASIGVSPIKMEAVESGSDEIGIREIDSLCFYYGTTSARILNPSAVHTDLVPRFRKLPETEDKHTFEATKLLNNLFSAEVELENVLGIVKNKNYPVGFDTCRGSVEKLAAAHAQELRDFLELGIEPISDIFSIISNELGIRLFQCKLEENSNVLGLYAYDKSLGASILLNARHSRPLRVISAAHELGHFMGSREKLEILGEKEQVNTRDELYANSFSLAFTMPEESFADSCSSVLNGSGELTIESVMELASLYNVPTSACVQRLNDLELAKNANEWYDTNGEISQSKENGVLSSVEFTNRQAESEDIDRMVPFRLSLLAHAAWKRELMSEGYLSSLLQLDRIDLREMLYEIENGELNFDKRFKQSALR